MKDSELYEFFENLKQTTLDKRFLRYLNHDALIELVQGLSIAILDQAKQNEHYYNTCRKVNKDLNNLGGTEGQYYVESNRLSGLVHSLYEEIADLKKEIATLKHSGQAEGEEPK